MPEQQFLLPKLPKDQYAEFKSYREARGVRIPSGAHVTSDPAAQERQSRYARRQVENLRMLRAEEGTPDWLREHLGVILAAWEKLAGPPKPPPFRFGAYCTKHNLESPERTLDSTEPEEARAMVRAIQDALRNDPPGDAHAARKLRGWIGAYKDRITRLSMDFGTQDTRKGPSQKELARKAEVRRKSAEIRSKMQGKAK